VILQVEGCPLNPAGYFYRSYQSSERVSLSIRTHVEIIFIGITRALNHYSVIDSRKMFLGLHLVLVMAREGVNL